MKYISPEQAYNDGWTEQEWLDWWKTYKYMGGDE